MIFPQVFNLLLYWMGSDRTIIFRSKVYVLDIKVSYVFSGLFRLLQVEGATPDRQCQPGTNQHSTFPLGIPGSLFGCNQALLSTHLKDVQNLGATRLSFLLVFMLSLF